MEFVDDFVAQGFASPSTAANGVVASEGVPAAAELYSGLEETSRCLGKDRRRLSRRLSALSLLWP